MSARARSLAFLVCLLAVVGGLVAAVVISNGEPSAHHVGVHRQVGLVRSGTQSCDPGAGSGVMGACITREAGGLKLTLGSATARPIPDVSEFQGRPNWRAAKGRIAGAIARVADLSTGRPDFSFSYNWHELRRLHIWHAAYAFVRPGNCTAEGQVAYGYVRAQGGLDSGPLIADAEVPLPFACVTQFTAAVERASGWHICVIYTAAGTWPGGLHDGCQLWDAAYGPTPGCVWTCARVAWQFTDGIFGPFPHSTPIGSSDLSRDEGITRIVHQAPCRAACQARRRRAAESATLARYRREGAAYARLIRRHACRSAAPQPRPSYRGPCRIWLVKYAHRKALIHKLLDKGVR